MSEPLVFVTGASGFIGANLVERLLANGQHVVGLSRHFPLQQLGLPQFSDQAYQMVRGDIGDKALLCRLFQTHKPTHLVHLAAQAIVGKANSSVASTFETNIRGFWCLLEAAREYGCLERIVIASSDKAYGQHDILPYQEQFSLDAVNPYDVSKKVAEELAMSYFHTWGLPVVITRCGNTFGPCDLNASRIVPGTIRSYLAGEPVVIRSDGKSERCYVYISDVIDAYMSLIFDNQEGLLGEAFNIGHDRCMSVLDFMGRIGAAVSDTPVPVHIERSARHEIDRQSLDCRKIESLLGWKPKTSLDVALQKTVDWYRSVSCYRSDFPWANP
jgi:CDP-glucose 4,6-dehydratase